MSLKYFISLIFIGFLCIVFILTIQPYLAYNNAIKGDILVVEGWLPNSVLDEVISEYKANNYQFIITTGGPIPSFLDLNNYQNLADWCADRLARKGVSRDIISAVPSPKVEKFKTYQSAKDLKEWLIAHNPNIHSITVMSQGTHSRRSHYLFKKALGNKYTVGIISVSHKEVSPYNWWRSYYGLKIVIKEILVYNYTRLSLFSGKYL